MPSKPTKTPFSAAGRPYPRHFVSAWHQCGFTLIEALIAALVLAIGLLGMASLQAVSMRFNHGAVLRTQATNLAYEITDAMRANVDRAKAGSYNIAFGATPPSGSAVAMSDLNAWSGRLDDALPSGQGRVAVDATGNAAVGIRWDSSRDSDSSKVDVNDPCDPAGNDIPAGKTQFCFRTRL